MSFKVAGHLKLIWAIHSPPTGIVVNTLKSCLILIYIFAGVMH